MHENKSVVEMHATPPVARGGQLLFGVSDRKKKGTWAKEIPDPQPPPPIDALTATFALNNRPRTSRTSVPKTRTGCVTCKRRRVKCDEARPACQKCIKWKGVCGGYEVASRRAPATTRPRNPGGKTADISGLLLMEPNEESLIFSDQIQKIHFDRWVSFMSDSTLFPTSLVTQILPQLARAEPALRHAAFAIGAAALDSETRKLVPEGTVSPYHQQAFAHYGRALRIIRSSKATKDNTLWAMLSCLLFVTFECLQGNRKSALVHLNHASTMMDQYLHLVGPKRRPTSVEDELVVNFQRLTVQSWTHNGGHPEASAGGEIPWCCRGRKAPYAVDEMPDTFSDLAEARKWWEVTQHHLLYNGFMVTGFRVRDASPKPPPYAQRSPQTWWSNPDNIPKFTVLVEKWQAGFTPLYEHALLSDLDVGDNRQRYLQAIEIRIAYLCLLSIIKSNNYTNVALVVLLTPLFKELMTLSRIILTSQSAASTGLFTMDNSPSWGLSITSILCRDQAVRDEAIALLTDFPRRDALWDTRVYLALALRNRELDEEEESLGLHLVGTEQERWERTFCRSVTFDGSIMHCTMMRPDPITLEWRMTQETIEI